MKIDGREIDNDTYLTSKICIVGAGAAGITLARSLSKDNVDVLLVESGGFEYDDSTQELYDGSNIGHAGEVGSINPTKSCRLRFFGGSTNHWAGNCRQLDEIDFQKKKYAPGTGWPISYDDFKPYYIEAANVCHIGKQNYDPKMWVTDETPQPFKIKGDKLKNTLYQISITKFRNFGEIYRKEIIDSKVIRILLYSNAVEIIPTSNSREIEKIKVKTLNGKIFYIKSSHFVIAMGGIENARLLLASRTASKQGVGNDYDSVGRYFMEHTHITSGIFLPINPKLNGSYYKRFKIPNQDMFVKGAMMPLPEQIKSREMLNASVSLNSIPRKSAKYIEAELSQGFVSTRAMRRSITRNQFPDDFWKHVYNIVSGLDDVVLGTYGREFAESELGNMYSLFIHAEQAPNRKSRVLLTDKVDALGMNQVALDWQLLPIDFKTIKEMQMLIALELGQSGLGRLFLPSATDEVWSDLIFGGCHHMGTTRMDINPKLGVVNSDARVHGVNNLWIAGSSIFPSSGAANPTLSIVAFTLRLADDLKKVLI